MTDIQAILEAAVKEGDLKPDDLKNLPPPPSLEEMLTAFSLAHKETGTTIAQKRDELTASIREQGFGHIDNVGLITEISDLTSTQHGLTQCMEDTILGSDLHRIYVAWVQYHKGENSFIEVIPEEDVSFPAADVFRHLAKPVLGSG